MTAAGAGQEALVAALRSEGLDTVEGAFAYGGGEDLIKPNLGARRRTRLSVTDADGLCHELYLKRYGPEGLADRLRRRWTYGRWCSPAGVEFANIRAARAAGVGTMREVLFAAEPVGPARGGRSHLVVTAVGGDAIERCGEDFLARHEGGPEAARLTERLAGLVREFHAVGYVHRDLYSSHVFLDEREDGFDLYLIDLARMFRPRWRCFRWRVKDLAQIKYSMPRRWVAKFWEAFLSDYLGGGDRSAALRYNRAIDRKVASMRRRGQARRRRGAGGGKQT